jgi:hypothetical protein
VEMALPWPLFIRLKRAHAEWAHGWSQSLGPLMSQSSDQVCVRNTPSAGWLLYLFNVLADEHRKRVSFL